MSTQIHPNSIRGPIEEEYNGLRDQAEKDYIEAKAAAEADYRQALADIAEDRKAALEAAGFNENGSVPPTFNVTAPENTAAPSVTGTPETGQTLTCANGTWTGADSFTRQWQRDGSPISGATSSTYVLQGADEGHAIRCRVTAHNEAGTTSANSNAVNAVAAG